MEQHGYTKLIQKTVAQTQNIISKENKKCAPTHIGCFHRQQGIKKFLKNKGVNLIKVITIEWETLEEKNRLLEKVLNEIEKKAEIISITTIRSRTMESGWTEIIFKNKK